MTITHKQRKEIETLITEVTNRPIQVESSNGGFFQITIPPLTKTFFFKLEGADKQSKAKLKADIRKELRSQGLNEMVNKLPLEGLPKEEPKVSDGAIYQAASEPLNQEELDLLTAPLIVKDTSQQIINELTLLVRMPQKERQAILISLALEELDSLVDDCLKAKKSKKEDAYLKILEIVETHSLDRVELGKLFDLVPEPETPSDGDATLDLESEFKLWVTDKLKEDPEIKHAYFKNEWETKFKSIERPSNWKSTQWFNDVKKELSKD